MEEFKTTDLGLAATLSVMGLHPDRLERSQSKRVTFHFSEYEKAKEICDQYFRKELKLDPLALFNAQKDLKTRIYNT